MNFDVKNIAHSNKASLIALIKLKQTYQFTTMCKGDINRHQPKTAKINLEERKKIDA